MAKAKEKGSATQEQIACIFCGRSVIKDKIDWDHFDKWSIDWTVRQVRQMLAGPGRKHRGKNPDTGFPAIRAEGLSIVAMNEDPNCVYMVDAIKKRLLKIVRAYIDAGIITENDLKSNKEEKQEEKETEDKEPKEDSVPTKS